MSSDACPTGPLVPLSDFQYKSGWDEEHPELADRPVFCVENSDVNGDGVKDKVGHYYGQEGGSQTTSCDIPSENYQYKDCTSNQLERLRKGILSTERYVTPELRYQQSLCDQDRYLPFSLGGYKNMAPTIYMGLDSGKMAVIPAEPLLFRSNRFENPSRTIVLNRGDQVFDGRSVLTFDPARLQVKRSDGLRDLEKRLIVLLNILIFKSSRAAKSLFGGQLLLFTQNPSKERVGGALRIINEEVPLVDRLTESQIDVLADLIFNHRKAIQEIMRRPFPAMDHDMTLGQYTRMIYNSHSSREDARAFDSFQGKNTQRDVNFIWGEVSERVVLSAQELFLINQNFATKSLGVNDNGHHVPLGTLMTSPISTPVEASMEAWAYYDAGENSCNWDDPLEPILPLGHIQFVLGAMPPSSEVTWADTATEVLFGNGQRVPIPATEVFYPTPQVPEEVSSSFREKAVIRPGDRIDIYYRTNPQDFSHPHWETAQGKVSRIARQSASDGNYLVMASDRQGNQYRGVIYAHTNQNDITDWEISWRRKDSY